MPTPFAIPNPGVDDQVWSDFVQHRRAKRAPVTTTVIRGFEREALKAGLSLEQAIVTACEMGWQGFRADWYARCSPSDKTAWQRGVAKRVAEFAPDLAALDPAKPAVVIEMEAGRAARRLG